MRELLHLPHAVRSMRKGFLVGLLLLTTVRTFAAQPNLDAVMPVRGFCIGAPQPSHLDEFIAFIQAELVPRHVNTLILMVDYDYQYKSHPELRNKEALSRDNAARLTTICRSNHITIIPEIDLLGHQSWAGSLGNLLRQYPEFDETPGVKMPEKYHWPNPDGLYCKSYCPLHPKVHEVVFALIDELCDAFGADTFHAGMDEVFYIGDDRCPRCAGRDKAALFAGEVRVIHDHLAQKGRRLWIWGDRLLDGRTTGLGMWEASYNNTYRAIDLIPKDVTICDWHYDRPDPTAPYFAVKGFNVVSCPWNHPDSAAAQARDMLQLHKSSTPEMRNRFLGVVQTVWSSNSEFLAKEYRSNSGERNAWTAFVRMSDEIAKDAGN